MATDACISTTGLMAPQANSRAADGLTVEPLSVACRNTYVGFTTFGEIRKMGYDVVRISGEGWHATVVVPADWAGEASDRLAQ